MRSQVGDHGALQGQRQQAVSPASGLRSLSRNPSTVWRLVGRSGGMEDSLSLQVLPRVVERETESVF